MERSVSEKEVQRVLRLAFLFGALDIHEGKVYVHGAPRKPVCRSKIAESMVQRGWLKANQSRYEITDEGRRVEREFNGYH